MPGICRWIVNCVPATVSVDAIACVQLAAVLDQLNVRAKDMSLYGRHWMSAAKHFSFLEVGN